MGFFRKFARKFTRLFRRGKKRMPRRGRKVKTLKRLVNRPFMVKKTVLLDKLQILCGGTTSQTLTFELTDLPQFAVYTQLYDQYKLNKVTVRYRMLNGVNVANVQGATLFHQTLGMVHSVVDYTDQTPPASIPALMNDSSYFGTKSGRDHVRSLRPKYLDVIAGAVQARSAKATWLHTDASNVAHYGLKTIFEGGLGQAGTASFYVEPIITYYFSFKDQKN